MIWTVIRRDLRLNLARGWQSGVALFFYLMVASLVPIATGPDARLLAQIAPGLLWLATLLATLLTLEHLFQPDAEDGSLDQFLTLGMSAELLVIARLISHWLTTILPLLLATPLAALLLALPAAQLLPLMLALTLGSPGLSAIGTIAGSLAIGVRRGGLLIVLLVLPLSIPILIFGVTCLAEPAAFKLLAACSLTALALAPFAAGAALRLAVA